MSGYNWIVAFEFALPSSHCLEGAGKGGLPRISVVGRKENRGVYVG